MIKKRLLIGAMVLALPAGLAWSQTGVAPQSGLPASVQSHVDKAYAILKGDVSRRALPGLIYLINDKVFPAPVPETRKLPNLPAQKAFDQFYYLGENWLNAWALNTPDGIILFDTLASPAEATTYIEEGLKKVGLDPKNIRYIVITHGHPDHVGGAKYLQDKYHAKVAMSAIDWETVLKGQTGSDAPPPTAPKRDMDLTDGGKLTLGGTTISFTLTPGHTPGTMSVIIPVTDKGKPHVISFIGGTGLNQMKDPSKGGGKIIRDSLARFARVSQAAGADVLISSHPFNDDAWDKAKIINDGKAGAVSPFVDSKDAVQRYYASAIEGVLAIEAWDALKPAQP